MLNQIKHNCKFEVLPTLYHFSSICIINRVVKFFPLINIFVKYKSGIEIIGWEEGWEGQPSVHFH